MFVVAESATTVVRLNGRFDPSQARSLQQLLAMFRPIRHVVIDFGAVRDVDDAAVASLARTLEASPESSFTFRGLSRHARRLLRYMGVDVDACAAGAPGAASEPATARAR